MKEQQPGLNSKFAPAVFPADILYDENLDSMERFVLLILFTYTNAHGNTAFPSYKTISERASISRNAAINIVKRLILKGYIIKQKNFRESKAAGKIEQTSNLYTLYFQIRPEVKKEGSNPRLPGVVILDDQGSNPRLPGVVILNDPNYPTELSIEEEEEETKDIPKKYIEMALKLGASKADLEVALIKMDSEPDIKNHIAWLRKALENEIINRELASRPKTKRDLKPSVKSHSTLTARQPKTNPNKYDGFYL